MAGWTNIPLTAGDAEWSSAATWAELFGAWNERRKAIGQSPVTPPARGDVIASHALVEQIQDWIEANCSAFARTYDSGGARLVNFDGEESGSIVNWTWTEFAENVLPYDGWLRKNDAGYFPGQHGGGDYASFAQLASDLRAAFNQLVWVRHASVAYAGSYKSIGFSDYGTLAEVSDLADAEFAAATPIAGVALPGAWYNQEHISGGENHHIVRISRQYATLTATPPGAAAWPLAGVVDFYLFAYEETGDDAFDDNGDPVKEGLWSLADTQLVGEAATSVDSVQIGSLDLPNRPTGDLPYIGDEQTLGYSIAQSLAVTRYDDPTGFQYY